ncbi:hypothetical protein [Desulfitobacterium sp.]|uniref:YkvI family membrane protein n=1 Tax=Desulfitobacterium sp. TaxID=49981 RepID=UPI002B9080D7|nr:hypothetical protein [Desulfitobacterium sp.]HVJ49121.1 hypothetical protein [Desulfitobacterium sp.]
MKWKVAFQVAATYVGAIMGAGFASGQEIQQFFANFGYRGLAGIILSACLFSAFGWIMLDLQERWKVSTYTDFFSLLMGEKWSPWIDMLISILLFVGMIAMMSGAGALFNQYFGLSAWTGILLTACVIFLSVWFKGEGVLWINTVLIPLKFLFCLGIAILAILLGTQGDGEGVVYSSNPLIQNWIFSAILYVSFNLTLALVVFASLGKEVQKPGARLGALLGGGALGLFAGVIGAALLRFPEVKALEIPMVAVAGKLGRWPAFLYVFVLWLAMITAAIGNAFSLVTRIVAAGKINYRLTSLGLLLLAFPLAGVRFSIIVKFVYPLFGYIGLLLLPLLFIRWRKH